jgi:hypothetical protein
MSAHILLRFLGICCFACLLVFSCIEFYTQTNPPSVSTAGSLYHGLHGRNLHPSEARPFPASGEFTYGASRKIDTGPDGPTVYARAASLVFGGNATVVVLIFDSVQGQSLPPFSRLAPEPTLHVGTSVFPARSIISDSQPGAEMKYELEFPPVGYIEGDAASIYLNEK